MTQEPYSDAGPALVESEPESKNNFSYYRTLPITKTALIVCIGTLAVATIILMVNPLSAAFVVTEVILMTSACTASLGLIYETNHTIRNFLSKMYNSLFGTAPTITKHANLPETLVPVEDATALSPREHDGFDKLAFNNFTNPGYIEVELAPGSSGTYKKVYIAPQNAMFCVVKGYVQEKQFIVDPTQKEDQAHLLMKAGIQTFDVRPFLDEPMVIAAQNGLEFVLGTDGRPVKLSPRQVFVIEKDIFGVPQIMVGQLKQTKGDVATEILSVQSPRLDLLQLDQAPTDKNQLSNTTPVKTPFGQLAVVLPHVLVVK